jgi:translation initiation factor 2B subunit (eIF-2B alpha/beta/delta family)
LQRYAIGCLLATHTALANDSLAAAAGAHMIAKAAKRHQTPIVVLSGVYKLNYVHCPGAHHHDEQQEFAANTYT